MMFPFIDPAFLLFSLPALLVAIYAQLKVHRTYGKYALLGSTWGATGYVAARRLLDAAGLYHVDVERVPGDLTDHYDPTTKTLRLSDSTFASPSVAALGVGAHEVGHAVAEVPGAAALTYVAGFAQAISQVLYFLHLLLAQRVQSDE